MVALYTALIINSRRTFASVPSRLKSAVRSMLNSLGLDENGDPIEDGDTEGEDDSNSNQ